jgi:hypothetical protein
MIRRFLTAIARLFGRRREKPADGWRIGGELPGLWRELTPEEIEEGLQPRPRSNDPDPWTRRPR